MPSDAPLGLGADPRLGAVLAELTAHPDWTGGAQGELSVAGAWPSVREICMLVRTDKGASLFVAVAPERRPWSILEVTTTDASTGEPLVLVQKEGYDQIDLCRTVVGRTEDPFPSEPSGIEVNGGWTDAAQVPAIAAALFADPESFGVDRSGRPSINVSPLGAPSADGLVCLKGTVYVGGPRAVVVLGLTQELGGWRVRSVRITEQALHPPAPPPPGRC